MAPPISNKPIMTARYRPNNPPAESSIIRATSQKTLEWGKPAAAENAVRLAKLAE
jgi:hypothetical protein